MRAKLVWQTLGARHSVARHACEFGSVDVSEHRGWYSRHYLPHFDAAHLLQVVTVRLADSLPTSIMAQVRRVPEAQAETEAFLDSGYGACWLREPAVAKVVETSLLHFDGTRYRVLAWCIMPNHVHMMIEQMEGHRLGDVVGSWKRFSALQANRILGRQGPFWQTEYFDRFIRDGGHYHAAIAYIENNPVKAGLVEQAAHWLWSSAKHRTV
ncbi:REP-associated tyrosine transposase [Vineibacter terrae]|uniref:REP-associated tyrosine transposase n=1 Tax=Vineibacter terrae TaxID=2586908 RepID=UPI002E32A015|nr:transposase [Vineibacter terrae]HEX2889871.1 transposase [Vineibacter terrae]